ncbi:hypothetical protein [Euzebya sp.]|uniref:hypothetical protein n=1 Tax=Euzebya sp. TaxID=1971409 RepID=UPI0035116129
MRLAERDVTGRVPDWAVTFLRDRCSALQRVLGHPARTILSLQSEEDSIHCWTLLLVAAAELPDAHREALESLHLLHARVDERLARGGVEDISPDVEQLVRAVLIDKLQRLTDEAVELLA